MFVQANKAIRAGAGFVADVFRKPISNVMKAGSWAAMRNATRARNVMTGGMYAGIGLGVGMVGAGTAAGISSNQRNPGMGALAGAGAGMAGAAAAYPLWAKYMQRSLRAIR